MADPTSIGLTVLGIGVVLTVVVAQILVRSGRPFLQDSFERPETAASVTRLLVLLFHLVVLGVIALVAMIDVSFGGAVETVVVRLGFVLLVLGAAHGGTLLLLNRLRKRRHEQTMLDEMNEQVRDARLAQVREAPADTTPTGTTPTGTAAAGTTAAPGAALGAAPPALARRGDVHPGPAESAP